MKRLLLLALCAWLAPLVSAAAQGVLHKFVGAKPGDRLGTVSWALDTDGDGFGDVVGGSGNSDDFGLDSGSMRLWSGRTGAVLHVFYGDSTDDQLGEFAAGVGDVDGDGFGDVAAGADRDDKNGPDSGSAWVYSGKSGALLHLILGDSPMDRLGGGLAGAGDVDADGRADVLIGATGDDNMGPNSGSARIVSGRTGAVLWLMNGDSADDRFGGSVSAAGDVDGDGFGDVIVGALLDDKGAVDAGSARVVSGRDGSTLLELHGFGPQDHFGMSVSGAGDVDTDGRADLLVSTPHADVSGVDSGGVWVFSGKDGAVLHAWFGAPLDRLGGSVRDAGDVDGDGGGDIVFSVPGKEHVEVHAGPNLALHLVLVADPPAEAFGRVSGAGDVNADGHADLIVGAYGDDANGQDAGSATVFSGTCGMVQAVGSACSAGLPAPPSLQVSGCAVALGSVGVAVSGGPAGGAAWLALGGSTATVPLPGGCTLYCGMPLVLVGPVPLDAGGGFTAALEVPFLGAPVTAVLQALFPLPGPGGIAATSGAVIHIP